ncbi:MAG: GMC oxidoreductase, partial [Deltaproteobacteria bacterium]|nr:GMC oxidoreductase [Deltaproteobacteria bacterium]
TRAHAATLAAALASPRVALRPNAVVSRILTDPHSGEATGVTYVDRVTRRAADVRARVVMVCASAIESARLLLNSRSARHPDGLGNASGSVGRFLMDHLFLDLQVRCALPEHLAATPGDERGDLYVAAAGPGAGRFGIELAVRAPAATPRHRLRAALGDLLRDQRPLARRWRPRRTCALDLAAIGEVTPHVENRVAVRDDVRDAWGIPVAHIAYRRGAEELAAARAMEAAALATVATGFEIIRARSALYPPGLSVHEMGTVRMGDDPRRSALNRHNQAWDCRTLFVTDAACFPTGGFQNPSLTIMALSLRASRWLARESNLF